MALENTLNEKSSFDIKCEPLDSGNRGQNDDLENKTLNLIKRWIY